MKCPSCKVGHMLPFGNKATCLCCKHIIHAAGAQRVVHERKVADGYHDQADRNDCAVRAYALAADLPHPVARERFAQAGRVAGKGTYHHTIAAVVGRSADHLGRGATLGWWLKTYPRGRWLIVVTGHALAVVDGVVHDLNEFKPRSRVLMAWRLA